jgi:hypothetical protein
MWPRAPWQNSAGASVPPVLTNWGLGGTKGCPSDPKFLLPPCITGRVVFAHLGRREESLRDLREAKRLDQKRAAGVDEIIARFGFEP